MAETKEAAANRFAKLERLEADLLQRFQALPPKATQAESDSILEDLAFVQVLMMATKANVEADTAKGGA